MAWTLGLRAADQLIERHLQEHGDYPRAIGLSIWGTATMRTGGDDFGQALALMGCARAGAGQPPRGGFRDPAGHRAGAPARGRHAARVGILPRCLRQSRQAVRRGGTRRGRAGRAPRSIRSARACAPQQPSRRRAGRRGGGRAGSLARVQRAPGGYGTGLQELVDARRWQDDADLAHAYLQAGGYAYGQRADGIEAARFRRAPPGSTPWCRTGTTASTTCWMPTTTTSSRAAWRPPCGTSAARSRRSTMATSAIPRRRACTLGEEIARVIRARVVNPKWLAGVRRHGYKGAFEMAATVDYLFGYDATTRVVADHQYALVADAYLNDPVNRAFPAQHNARARCTRSASACSKPCSVASGRSPAPTARSSRRTCSMPSSARRKLSHHEPAPTLSIQRPVGGARLQRALMLAAVDAGIGGVLVGGPTAESTAARARSCCRRGASSALPLGASEEQLVGSLDLDHALRAVRCALRPACWRARPRRRAGVDEVNLLPDHRSTCCSTPPPAASTRWSATGSRTSMRRASCWSAP